MIACLLLLWIPCGISELPVMTSMTIEPGCLIRHEFPVGINIINSFFCEIIITERPGFISKDSPYL